MWGFETNGMPKAKPGAPGQPMPCSPASACLRAHTRTTCCSGGLPGFPIIHHTVPVTACPGLGEPCSCLVHPYKPPQPPAIRAGTHGGLSKQCQGSNGAYFSRYLLHLFEVIVKLGPFGPSDLLTDQLGDRRREKSMSLGRGAFQPCLLLAGDQGVRICLMVSQGC